MSRPATTSDVEAPADELGRTFVAAWPGDGSPLDPESIGVALIQHIERGRSAWPGVDVDMHELARFVAARVDSGADPIAALASLRSEDLVLVCACATGCEVAAHHFRSYVKPAILHAASRVAVDSTDDLLNRVYDRLFLSSGESPARIAHYGARGELRRWVSVVATRLAIDGRRRSKRQDDLHTAAFDRLLADGHNVELDYLRGLYRREFKHAFTSAIESLDDRQRNVLRYQLDGLTADQVGRLYNVHRVTVARWLSRIRSTLFEQTRAQLRMRLDLRGAEADSILRLVEGEVSVSLARLLGQDAPDAGDP